MKIHLTKRGLASFKTACFRVDAGPGIGLGHFMRCKTIAEELIDCGWTVFLVGENLPDNNTIRPRTHTSFNVIDRRKVADSNADVFDFCHSIFMGSYGRVNLLVIDSYSYTQADFAHIARRINPDSPDSFVFCVIDDIANRDTPSQVVINPNPLMSPKAYERQHIPTIMCGANYTIIRPEVLEFRNRVYSSKGHILITLGGGNVVQLLMKVLNALPVELENSICVSVSPECPIEQLSNWANENTNKRFINNDIAAFPELLAGASMVITAGGTTLWESYCIGVPGITIVWVDNQVNTLNIIQKQATGFLVDLISKVNTELNSDALQTASDYLSGDRNSDHSITNNYKTCEIVRTKKTGVLIENADSINSKFFKEAICKLLTDEAFSYQMRMKQRALIDGLGVKRIVDEIEPLVPVSPQLFF